MSDLSPEQRLAVETKFIRILSMIAAVLALVPVLRGYIGTPVGAFYLPYAYNMDDHMVYAAWMRQAMDGHFLFDNRFATDVQPGLTIHAYFLLLGWLAKLVTIPIATLIARMGFSVLFVHLLFRLFRQLMPDTYTTKLMPVLVVFGGGLGFLVWHNFGLEIVRPEAAWIAPYSRGHLPIDVWQPEAFVFPSMLNNGLFMVSLCLTLAILCCAVQARTTSKTVLPGAGLMLLLMNIHSYDVVIVALIFLGLLVGSLATQTFSKEWCLRVVGIGLGAVPSALWFMYVLKRDAVFQARAATPTYSPVFVQIILGVFPMMALGLCGLVLGESAHQKRRLAGGALFLALVIGMLMVSPRPDTFALTLVEWGLLTAGAFVSVALLARPEPLWNLVNTWAIVGTFAPYFPGLFQRKLAMGIAIPWAVLAALGIAVLIRNRDRGSRNLITVLTVTVLSASSLRWLVRQIEFNNLNTSNTTVHALYLSGDAKRIIDYFNTEIKGRAVVVAMPGIPFPDMQSDGTRLPDSFSSPYLTDLNPVLSGLTGVYTYAGHWSETPEYLKRRSVASSIFLTQAGARPIDDQTRAGLIKTSGANYLVCPVPSTFKDLPLADLRRFGQVVVDGPQFYLLKVN